MTLPLGPILQLNNALASIVHDSSVRTDINDCAYAILRPSVALCLRITDSLSIMCKDSSFTMSHSVESSNP